MRRSTISLSTLLCACLVFAVAGCQSTYPAAQSAPEPHRAGGHTAGSTQSWHWNGDGCCDVEPQRGQPAPPVVVAPPPKPLVVLAPPPPPPAPTPSGIACAEVYYPTGNQATSTLHLKKCAPAEVQVGVAFEYVITIRNISGQTLRNVILTDQLAESFSVSSVDPQPTTRDGLYMRWHMGDMLPGYHKRVRVTGTPTGSGKLVNCVTATYDLPACLAIDVINPQLVVRKTAPTDVLKCDTIPVKLTVTNTGTGPARNVQVLDALPDGLLTVDGKRAVQYNVGTLNQGQSRTYDFSVKASRSGNYTNRVVARADGGLNAEASTTTVVRQPVLTIRKTGPAKRFLNRPIGYTITVTNSGDGVAKNTILEDPIPQGAKWVRASNNGQPAGGNVRWNLGTLQPGDSRQVTMEVLGTQIGTVRNTATARAYCADAVSDSASTLVAGIPAILLEVVDNPDPVEVGNETTYTITVTNQGSSPATGIVVTCNLENQAQYVDSRGTTRAAAAGQTVTFAPVPTLAPKAKAQWQMRVKAVGTGDIRFHVRMNSDQIDRDVSETEATHFYQ